MQPVEPSSITTLAFWLFSVAAVVAAGFVVVHRNPVVCAVALVKTFVAVAGLYLTMNAQFLTAVQILVYAGAIMVLFLFVIMLLNLERDPQENPNIARLVGAALSVVLVFGLASLLGAERAAGVSIRPATGTEIGRLFFGDYLFAFEMASLLLLVAMIGAIVVARRAPGKEAS